LPGILKWEIARHPVKSSIGGVGNSSLSFRIPSFKIHGKTAPASDKKGRKEKRKEKALVRRNAWLL